MAVKYDYKCRSCGKIWEESHSVHESPRYTCECGSEDTFKMIGATRTIFKGGGWAGREADYDRMGVPAHVRKHADERL